MPHGPVVLALSAFVLATVAMGCSLLTSWDGMTGAQEPSDPSDASRDELAVEADAEPEIDAAIQDGGATADAPTDGPSYCTANAYYCGGHVVGGDPNSLYRCLADGGIEEAIACARGCFRRSSGNDACRCVVGAPYCGNDQVLGNPNSLYRCTADFTAEFITRCDMGCAVIPQMNDACRK